MPDIKRLALAVKQSQEIADELNKELDPKIKSTTGKFLARSGARKIKETLVAWVGLQFVETGFGKGFFVNKI